MVIKVVNGCNRLLALISADKCKVVCFFIPNQNVGFTNGLQNRI